jgi:hypothetical protein
MWYQNADSTWVALDWYEDAEARVRYSDSKAARRLCSASYCEEQAKFLTIRSGRNWALCEDHAKVLTTGYWKPGLGIEGGPR